MFARIVALVTVTFVVGCPQRERPPQSPAPAPAASIEDRAAAIAQKLIIADGHVDLPYRLDAQKAAGKPVDDPSKRTIGGHFDFPRAKAGGLDAPFMSIYVPASFQESGGAKAKADALIDLVEGLAASHPEAFVMARTPDDVIAAKTKGLVAFPMGIENGAALEDDLANVRHFYDRGVRYITLTHSKDNLIGDSSYDERRTHGGLTPFGKKVVAEMNRVGVMVDISHVSDQTFDDVIAIAKAPPIASHSSCRHFTPGWERNMKDASIKKLADAGGVILINFGASFLTPEMRKASDARRAARDQFMAEARVKRDDPKVDAFMKTYDAQHALPLPSAADIANHVDHVVKLVGIDHVGLGSDYDGVTSLPKDMGDASTYPVLFAELLRRGYTEQDLEKIASGNLFRVWRQVADVAASSGSAQ